jgi:hypothetical protein
MIASLLRWRDPGAVHLLIGGTLYLVGTFLVTLAFNVPKNKALASVAPSDPEGASLWTDYLSKWTAWNHVRAATALAAAAFLTIPLFHGTATPRHEQAWRASISTAPTLERPGSMKGEHSMSALRAVRHISVSMAEMIRESERRCAVKKD